MALRYRRSQTSHIRERHAVSQSQAPKALFVGDSYTSGWALDPADAHLKFSTLVAEHFGWLEINAGCPGSGYVASGPVCHSPFKQTLNGRAQSHPDVVILSGGINDLYSDDERIAKAIRQTISVLPKLFPRARVAVVTPVAPSEPERLDAMTQALASACDANGVTLLSIGQPLVESAPIVAPGAHSKPLIGPDGLHPTVAGHAALASAITREYALAFPAGAGTL